MKNRGSTGVRKFGMITYAYKGSIPTGMSNGTFGMSSFSGLPAPLCGAWPGTGESRLIWKRISTFTYWQVGE